MKQTKRRGFTLIELMVVLAILSLIAGIAIVNLMRAKMTANEASAVGGTRTIATSEACFFNAHYLDADGDGTGDFATLAQLLDPSGGGATPPYIDAVLGSGEKQGYQFDLAVTLGAPGQAPAYVCAVHPITPGGSGWRRFYVDQSGVIRATNDGAPADQTSPPLS